MTRPNIKLSEATGEQTKEALQAVKDAEDLDTLEDAIRYLLPGWALPAPPGRAAEVEIVRPSGRETRSVGPGESMDISEDGPVGVRVEVSGADGDD